MTAAEDLETPLYSVVDLPTDPFDADHRRRMLEAVFRYPTRVAAARVVSGDQWVRDREVRWQGAAVREDAWWIDALAKLHRQLADGALAPARGIRRWVVPDEAHRCVTLYVETSARPGEPSGLPAVVLAPLGGLAGCPAAGDVLWTPR